MPNAFISSIKPVKRTKRPSVTPTGKTTVSAEAQSFFDNMAEQYRQADLIICRAGATTVAEITALGKAAIFIPFPYAADNHQMLNAADLANDGAAEIIVEKELNGQLLSEKIKHYLGIIRRL